MLSPFWSFSVTGKVFDIFFVIPSSVVNQKCRVRQMVKPRNIRNFRKTKMVPWLIFSVLWDKKLSTSFLWYSMICQNFRARRRQRRLWAVFSLSVVGMSGGWNYPGNMMGGGGGNGSFDPSSALALMQNFGGGADHSDMGGNWKTAFSDQSTDSTIRFDLLAAIKNSTILQKTLLLLLGCPFLDNRFFNWLLSHHISSNDYFKTKLKLSMLMNQLYSNNIAILNLVIVPWLLLLELLVPLVLCHYYAILT